MWHRIRWSLVGIRHKLWARPLMYAALAPVAVAAGVAGDLWLDAERVPEIDRDAVGSLLTIMAASMLSVATLAVASMVSAYASATSTATPRAFSLVIADDVSQTALSGFIGAFIFSIVALTSVKSGLYGRAGVFVTFLITLAIFLAVILIFLRWVDRIARLGRLGTTIDRVERAAFKALERRRCTPTLGGKAATGDARGRRVLSKRIGYVQTINMAALQRLAHAADGRVTVDALPGTFVGPGRALALFEPGDSGAPPIEDRDLAAAFIVGDDRTFDEDPRFGLVALAEVAARALSPATNDPGTAIDIIGTFVRLFALWAEPGEAPKVLYDRVFVPELSPVEMFDDAFTAIARDGAGSIEVAIRLQKAFIALASTGHPQLRSAAALHSKRALARAEIALQLAEERERIAALAASVVLAINLPQPD